MSCIFCGFASCAHESQYILMCAAHAQQRTALPHAFSHQYCKQVSTPPWHAYKLRHTHHRISPVQCETQWYVAEPRLVVGASPIVSTGRHERGRAGQTCVLRAHIRMGCGHADEWPSSDASDGARWLPPKGSSPEGVQVGVPPTRWARVSLSRIPAQRTC